MSQCKDRLRHELAESRAYLLSVAEHIGPDQALNSTENPAWNVHDLLAHLAGAERGMQATVHRFLDGVELPVDFSLDYWNHWTSPMNRSRQTHTGGRESLLPA